MLVLNYTGDQSKIINVDVSIDVIIPSFRLNETNLLPAFQWEKPVSCIVNYYLVVDNPDAEIPVSIRHLADQGFVRLIINERNSGASFTRNRAIDAGKGDWILMLDDDLEFPENLLFLYDHAARTFPEETGFIGMIRLPAASTDFSKAILTSGSMDIFSIAERKAHYPWGATANVMLRRSALQGIRFSLLYPKSGGGEDVDFFLKIRERNRGRNLKTLPEAVVCHPWWHQGRPDYRKSWRYGTGNSLLGQLNPAYAYYDFLNTPETVALLIPLLFILLLENPHRAGTLFILLPAVLLTEIIASLIQSLKRNPKTNYRVLFFVLAMRMVYETGLLWGNLSRFRFQGIGERFHDDGRKNKFFFYRTNTHKVIKWILYPLFGYFIFRYYF